MNQRPAFNIGISMAGAVSGGAYSAGVFDFLMEALDEWHKAKERGENVPQHDVYISAISGTSAGGITAAMGIASLAAGIRSVEEPSANTKRSDQVKRTLPELYDVWVRKVKLFSTREEKAKCAAANGAPALLDTGDIKPCGAPDSLLNSDVLTNIARDGLLAIRPNGKTLPFFTNPTHLFLTHTNLDGVPYPIDFARDGYSMMLHEGRTHFAIKGLGRHPYPEECKWLKKWGDDGIDLDVRKLGSIAPSAPDTELQEPFESFAQAALTTSAFPFGFSARRVKIDTTKMRKGAMPFDPGTFPDELNRKELESRPFYQLDRNAHFVCIDGGAMNNEPFEIVRWAIRDSNDKHNARHAETANRAVLLIAPFPPRAASNLTQLAQKDRDVGIGFIGKALIPALINQARFKASDLIAASDPNVYSRFLISPQREKDKTKPALASSSLEAFGGFLDEQFREHDFQLGRRNCQWFLRQHFTLHTANPVFGLNAEPHFKAIEAPKYPYDANQWPIIPLVGSAAVEVPLLEWPVMPRRNLVDLREALLRRLDLLARAYSSHVLSQYPAIRSAARLSWWRHRGEVASSLVDVIDRQLEAFGQIEPKPPQSILQRLWDRFRSPHVVLKLIVGLAILVIAYEVVMDRIFL